MSWPPRTDPGRHEALLPVRYEPDSHAATLVELPDGTLLCAWFNGPGEGDPGTNIVLSRLPAGSDRWSEPALVAADPHRSEQNPLLFCADEQTVWLLHTSNEPHDQTTSHVLLRTSTDEGRTWSEPRVLFDGPGFFIRNPPLFRPDGSWLLPAYRCRPEGELSVVVETADRGRTWREYEVPGSLGRPQMSIVPRADRTLFAVFRSRDADRIYASTSDGAGRQWTPPERTGLPNNDSSIQLVRLRGGAFLLAYNDASLERDQFRWVGSGASLRKRAVRTPLTLALSEDGGRSWPHRRNVQQADEEYRHNEAGYSYPAVVQGRDGSIHLAFSYLRKTIKYVRLAADWVCAS